MVCGFWVEGIPRRVEGGGWRVEGGGWGVEIAGFRVEGFPLRHRRGGGRNPPAPSPSQPPALPPQRAPAPECRVSDTLDRFKDFEKT